MRAYSSSVLSDKVRTASANVLNGLKNDSLPLGHWRSNFKTKDCLSRES